MTLCLRIYIDPKNRIPKNFEVGADNKKLTKSLHFFVLRQRGTRDASFSTCMRIARSRAIFANVCVSMCVWSQKLSFVRVYVPIRSRAYLTFQGSTPRFSGLEV